MQTSGAGTFSPGHGRKARSARRVALLVAIVAAVIQMQTSVGATQGTTVAAIPAVAEQSAPGSFQTRLCNALRAAHAANANRPAVQQALLPWLARYGCPAGQPPVTTVPPSTTTTFHVDCPLPGGGVGPCPTTTITAPPTTVPPGGTTIPPPSTTLPPCPSTTTTVPTTFPSTTIPCQP